MEENDVSPTKKTMPSFFKIIVMNLKNDDNAFRKPL